MRTLRCEGLSRLPSCSHAEGSNWKSQTSSLVLSWGQFQSWPANGIQLVGLWNWCRIMEGKDSLLHFSPEAVVLSSVFRQVATQLPPITLFHGTADYTIPCDARWISITFKGIDVAIHLNNLMWCWHIHASPSGFQWVGGYSNQQRHNRMSWSHCKRLSRDQKNVRWDESSKAMCALNDWDSRFVVPSL